MSQLRDNRTTTLNNSALGGRFIPALRELEVGEYGFPGPLRDRLVKAILSGEKTATSSLYEEYLRSDETVPSTPGGLELVVDSAGKPVCVTRDTSIELVRMGDISDEFAVAEGEGFANAAQWRRAHEEFWTSPDFIQSVGDPVISLNDDTLVVAIRFEVVHRVSEAERTQYSQAD